MCQNWNPGNPLPNAEDAEIDIRKFEQYSMDPNNPRNQGKWTAFAAIGYDVQSLNGRHAGAQDVINQLRANLVNAPASKSEASIYGDRFEVKVKIKGPLGKEGILVTVWQIDNNIEVPRLITNWLKVSQEEEEQQDES